jgi:hypothetical protein
MLDLADDADVGPQGNTYVIVYFQLYSGTVIVFMGSLLIEKKA